MAIGAAGVIGAFILAFVLLLWCRRRRAIQLQTARQVLLLNSTREGVAPDVFESAEFVCSLGRGSSGVVTLMRVRAPEHGEHGEQGALVVRKTLTFNDYDARAPPEGVVSGRQSGSRFSEHLDVLYEMYHEVRVLAQMSHPHIIRYLHAARPPGAGELHIYMEYADGGTLAAAVTAQRGKPFTSELVQRWTWQLSSALQHVHAQGVLHRDLKLANVFLTQGRAIKLGDFGVARLLSTHTHFAQTMVGTPYYLAPEVLRSAPYAFAADVWSVGVILFELLTLRKPFESTNLGALVHKVENGDYDRSALSTCAHPPELRRLASHECLLHPDPSERMRLDELLCDPTLADAANDEAKSLGHMPTPSFSAPGTTLNESSSVSSAAAFSQTPTPP